MDITIFNPADGSTITISPDGEGVVFIPQNVGASGGNRVLILRGATGLSAGSGEFTGMTTVGWKHWGDLVATLDMDADYVDPSLFQLCALSYTLANGQPVGTYWQTVQLREPTFIIADGSIEVFALHTFRIKIEVVPAAVFVSPLSWMPADLIDFQMEVTDGRIRSFFLSRRQLKVAAGAASLFGVVVLDDGTVITSGVTALSLDFREQDDFTGAPLLTLAGTGSDFVAVSSNGYYALTGAMTSDALTQAFERQNALPADPGNADRNRALRVLAQLTITKDGVARAGEHVEMFLVQPVATTTEAVTEEIDAIELDWDTTTGVVTCPTPAAAIGHLADGEVPGIAPLIWLKSGDTRLLHVRPRKSGVVLDVEYSALTFTLKGSEPDAVAASSSSFVRVGTGTNTFYRVAITVDGSTLRGELSGGESDAGTEIVAVGELEGVFSLSALDPALPSGPSDGRSTSLNFGVGIARNLTP